MWIDLPSASAEILKDGTWAWTPLPSGSITEHPAAVELCDEETATLQLPD